MADLSASQTAISQGVGNRIKVSLLEQHTLGLQRFEGVPEAPFPQISADGDRIIVTYMIRNPQKQAHMHSSAYGLLITTSRKCRPHRSVGHDRGKKHGGS
jgi:hypothetical protein